MDGTGIFQYPTNIFVPVILLLALRNRENETFFTSFYGAPFLDIYFGFNVYIQIALLKYWNYT